MTVAEKIEKLRAYALTAKTCIYNEDAMTAIQLAGQTACKVNECVEAINLMLDTIEDTLKLLGVEYDPETEELKV